MATFNSWVRAARLRTLPLALSGIITSSGLAILHSVFNWNIFALAMLTATGLQIFSNFANDYGDHLKGTDNDQRLGPTRTMQGGEISVSEMKKGMWLIGILSFIIGLMLIYISNISALAIITFTAMGLLCLLAAYFYTAGKHSYGYIGLGDLSVFIFFGLIAVGALFYLYAHFINHNIVLPAISIACFSTGVLNLNNMRDRINDSQSGKITIVVRIGAKSSRLYHSFLIIIGWMASLFFIFLNYKSPWQLLILLALPLFIKDLIQIIHTKEDKLLDPFLKKLSLSTLLFSVLFIVGSILTMS